jgi:hypothetical protein
MASSHTAWILWRDWGPKRGHARDSKHLLLFVSSLSKHMCVIAFHLAGNRAYTGLESFRTTVPTVPLVSSVPPPVTTPMSTASGLLSQVPLSANAWLVKKLVLKRPACDYLCQRVHACDITHKTCRRKSSKECARNAAPSELYVALIKQPPFPPRPRFPTWYVGAEI